MRSVTTAMTVGLLLALGTPALAEDSKDPIKMTLHDWTGQLITTRLMGEALKNAGLNVEYVQADYLAQFAGLKTGDLDVAMEIWATTGKDAMDEATATGKVENLGETGMLAIEEWWYPEYMKEKCPGLPDWEALKKCAEQFSTPETAPKGRYLGGPATWGGFDEERVAALDMPFRGGPCRNRCGALRRARDPPISAKPRSSNGSMPRTGRPSSTRANGSSSRNTSLPATRIPSGASTRPRPTTAASRAGPIWKVSWSGLKDKWPSAYDAIKKFNINNDEMGAHDHQGRYRRPKGRGRCGRMDEDQRGPLEGLGRQVTVERLD